MAMQNKPRIISSVPAVGLFAKLKRFFRPEAWTGDIDTNEKSRQAVKDAYEAENNKLNELTRQTSELEGKLGQDFGHENVFQALHDR